MTDRDVAVLELGRLLVWELGLDGSTDTLGRWMAHHVAELLDAAQFGEGDEQAAAQEACRETIVALWKHRSGLPGRTAYLGRVPGLATMLRRRQAPLLAPLMPSYPGDGDMEAAAWVERAHDLESATATLTRAVLRLTAIAIEPDDARAVHLAEAADAMDREDEIVRSLLNLVHQDSFVRKEDVREAHEVLTRIAVEVVDAFDHHEDRARSS